MLVFDDVAPTREAIRYSVELAHRMGSSLVLLMLLADGVADRARKARAAEPGRPADEIESRFGACIELAGAAEVPVEIEIKIGDPSSELIKFLAEARRVHTIVWGGDGDAVRRKSRTGKGGHWFARMRDRVELPVVVPMPRS